MNYQIKIEDDVKLSDLLTEVRSGGKFIVFPYCISLIFAVTLKRFSPAIFIKENEPISKYQRKYNLLSYIFGWWCIPYGPIHTLQCIKTNNEGGINITEDIMLNITEESLRNKEIKLINTTILFKRPELTDIKAIQKAATRLPKNYKVKKLVVGIYINVDAHSEPYFVLGLNDIEDFADYTSDLRQALYTKFYKHVRFEFTDLTESHEMNTLLQKQGVEIILE